jgi:hypothetical protein
VLQPAGEVNGADLSGLVDLIFVQKLPKLPQIAGVGLEGARGEVALHAKRLKKSIGCILH